MKNESGKIIEELPKDIDSSGWPTLRLKNLTLRNFGAHENVEVDFSEGNDVLGMTCLVGPNGTGKTTILNAIQLLFNNYNGYTTERYRAMMAAHIRNVEGDNPMALDHGFSVKGVFLSDGAEYEVEVTNEQVVSKHPEGVSSRFTHYCYYANFDRELHMFTLKRQRWEQFRKFFSGMTGYAVAEDKNEFDQSDNREYANMMKEYVLGFRIEKPEETISHRRCSAGEKKVIKCFSTILNRAVQPPIILIDNVTDHVEVGRHLPLMQHMQECFPGSQIISTCHSVPVQRNFPDRNKIIDMRAITVKNFVAAQPWRFRMYDEVWDAVEKVNAISGMNEILKAFEVASGNSLLDLLMNEPCLEPEEACEMCLAYIKSTIGQVCEGLKSCPPSRITSR